MASAQKLTDRMSAYLDISRPGVDVIRLKCRRATARKFAKPEWPGGPLMYQGREIVTTDPVTKPTKPEPKAKKLPKK